MSKRTLVLNAFNKKEVERVPVGFWFHFIPENTAVTPFYTPQIINQNIYGHNHYIKNFLPDFIKLMSDGFGLYPNPQIAKAKSIYDLKNISPLGENHPWIKDQVQLVKDIKSLFPYDMLSIYNIFSPSKYFKYHFKNGNRVLADFILENGELTKNILNVIASDIVTLIKKLITEVGIDGIYFSVQTVQDKRLSSVQYIKSIMPSDLIVLDEANRYSENNVLHICSHHAEKNDLTIFQNYSSKVVNWGIKAENLSLKEGKTFFNGRAILGGFDNTTKGILYTGTQEEVEEETKKIIDEVGSKGLILGADCSLPQDINISHLNWVRNQAIRFSSVPVGGLK